MKLTSRDPGLVLLYEVLSQLAARGVFFALLSFVAIPSRWSSPVLGLGSGVAFGLLLPHPYAARARRASKTLLQASVVALGFAMNLSEVVAAGRAGFAYSLASIAFALGAGWVLGRVLGVPRKVAFLVSVGTAICGGSAIAAIGPASDAGDDEMSVSIGTVFILNAAGLVLFPLIGHALALSQPQFGLWAALAIHDTSSVVGAGAKYGAVALTIATTVKLARALWIVPLTLATAAARSARKDGIHKKGKKKEKSEKKRIAWPWFILLFLGAALLRTALPSFAPLYGVLSNAGRIGLSVTLFLIGTGMSRASLRAVGARPLVHGVLLWILVASVSLLVIRAGWVRV
jgi:uncharacterized integral membrane protein (TIGR00698 family)